MRYSIPDSPCGVYHLLDGDHIMYVGQSVNVLSRVSSWASYHHRGFNFDAWEFFPCARDELNALEQGHIERFDPPFNRAGRTFPFIPAAAWKRQPRAVLEHGGLDAYLAQLPILVNGRHLRDCGLAMNNRQLLTLPHFPRPAQAAEHGVNLVCRWRKEDVARWLRTHGGEFLARQEARANG